MHKFKIVAAKDGQFRVQFLYNSEVIVWSENYKAKPSAKNCIESLKKNAPGAPTVDLSAGEKGTGYHFAIVAGKTSGFFVRFVASNGETMVISESYTTKKNALNAIESVKKNGPKAEVVDESIAAKPAPKSMAAKAPSPPSVKAPVKPAAKAAAKPAAKAAAKPAAKAAAKPAAKAAAKPAAAKAAPAKTAKPAAKAAAKPAAKAAAKPAAKAAAKPAAKAAAKPAAKAAAKPAAKSKAAAVKAPPSKAAPAKAAAKPAAKAAAKPAAKKK